MRFARFPTTVTLKIQIWIRIRPIVWKAFWMRTLWPEDANELIELADDYPTVEDLGDPYYFDKLRERINRLGLRPDDGHDLEDTLGEF